MTVRDAREADAEAIFGVHRASIEGLGPEAYDEAQVAAWGAGGGPDDYDLDVADSRFVVAEAGDVAESGTVGEGGTVTGDEGVVGFGEVVLRPPDYLREPAEGEVRAVYVHPAAARQGVGSAILAALERRARERDVGSLGLWASLNAVPFYEAHGYERVAERTHEFSGGVEGTVVEMRRDDLFAARRRSPTAGERTPR